MITPSPNVVRAVAPAAVLVGMLWLAALPAAPPPAIEDRDLEVIAALINHGLEADTPLVVIAERTTGDPAAVAANDAAIEPIVTGLEVPRAAFDDWTTRNRVPYLIDRPLDLPVSYQLLDEKTLSELFKDVAPEEGWRQFFQRYAGAPGILRVSRPGFDDTLSHAIVYVEHACGANCGAGRLVHLERQGENPWTVRDGAMVWMTK